MKLIDLLVQELPKRGGWPEEAGYCWQDYDKEVRPVSSGFGFHTSRLAENHRAECGRNPEPGNQNCVTREQYEAALATAQQPAWNGEGLPPVGFECEAHKHSPDRNDVWVRVKIMYLSEFTAVMQELEKGSSGEVIHHPRTLEFRPIRTEAERRREKFMSHLTSHGWDKEVAEELFNDIAAGKIPGVKLED